MAVAAALDTADCPLHIKPPQGEYVTYGTSPSSIHDTESYGRKMGMPENANVGHNIVHNVSRAKATHIPLNVKEMTLIQDRHRMTRFARLADDSLTALKMGWRHRESVCYMFKRPKFLVVDTTAQQASAAAQAELFMNHECAVHDIRAETVIQKLWVVSAKHKQARMPDPFYTNGMLTAIIANNTALDAPSQPKAPVTNTTLKVIRGRRRPDFMRWTFLCRISSCAEFQSGLYTTSTQCAGSI